MLNRTDLVHEVVAAGAVDTPVVGQNLTNTEDFLDDKIGVAAGCEFIQTLAEPAAVAGGIGQAIHVVNAKSVDQAVSIQAEQSGMGLLEYTRDLNAEAGKPVDVEEPAPIDFVARCPPPGETVMLTLQQRVKLRSATGLAGSNDSRPHSLMWA